MAQLAVVRAEVEKYVSILYLRCGGAEVRVQGVRSGARFNSLFEMLYYPPIDFALDPFSIVSILYLRCKAKRGVTMSAAAATSPFQFSRMPRGRHGDRGV